MRKVVVVRCVSSDNVESFVVRSCIPIVISKSTAVERLSTAVKTSSSEMVYLVIMALRTATKEVVVRMILNVRHCGGKLQ